MVTSAADVVRIAPDLKPGDTLVLRDGVWADQQITLDTAGTAELPITIRAQTPGKVILTGKSSLTLAGRYLVAKGLLFRDVAGDDVSTIAVTGSYCRVTECAVDGGTSSRFVHLIGPENRLDHCYIAGKTSENPTVQVEAPAGQPPGNNRIDHNHFGPRPPLKRNGGETIRVGYSHQQTNVSRVICESNLFDRCDGELEIISNKSCENVYRYNTFRECAGTLTLRHGDRCVVDGNVILGERKPDTGGIRLCGEGHIITNNYVAGVTTGGLRLTTGVVNPEPKDHQQARNSIIAHNTFAESAGPNIYASVGYSHPNRTLRPGNILFLNNVFAMSSDGELIQGAEGGGNQWAGNFVEGKNARERKGVTVVELKLGKASDGLLRPALKSPIRGSAAKGDFLPAQVEALLAEDIDGQRRGAFGDAGCDQVSDDAVSRRALAASDVGPAWPLPDP